MKYVGKSATGGSVFTVRKAPKARNIRVINDGGGYFARYSSDTQDNLDEPLDATDERSAVQEAARHFGVSPSQIKVER